MHDAPLHILFISSWFPNHNNPSSGDFVLRHAQAASLSCKVSCLHVEYDPFVQDKVVAEITKSSRLNQYMFYYSVSPFAALLGPVVKFWRRYSIYKKGLIKIQKEQGKIDVIHANITFSVSIIAWLLNLQYGIPYVISEHWTGFITGVVKKKNVLHTLAARLAVAKASALLPVTQQLGENMKRNGFVNTMYVIPNVVDTTLFFPGNNASRQKKHILHVSNLRDQHKNISGILRVIKKLSLQRDDFILTIIGSLGLAYTQRLILQMNIPQGMIRLMGFMSNAEVSIYMRDADFFVLFSNYENQPCVILEALACGIPVISTRTGSIPEVINQKNGILVDEGNEVQLFDAIVYMLDHHTEYEKKSLYSYATEHFSYEKVSEKLKQIYTTVVAKKSVPVL